jgi:Arc/MetJ-type ribon-helix-helix transcriptional regulator
MTIHLPQELEGSIRSIVQGGRYASEDDFVAEAVRSFLRQQTTPAAAPGLGLIGALHDDADLLDQAVEHAMKIREERPSRQPSGETINWSSEDIGLTPDVGGRVRPV